MTFAFNPDNGPARLIRYVEPGTMPGLDLISILDPVKNLLIINRELFYNKLTDVDQKQLLRTQRTSVTLGDYGYPSEVPAIAAE